MTARGPGGRIAPDGRPPRAKGVGKNARRHDLEAPATPGLHGSDLQQGDVQMMEQGQRVAPRPKRQQAAAGPNPRGRQRRGADRERAGMEVPDPIAFASQKIGGQVPTGEQVDMATVDPRPWLPLLEQFVTQPNANPAIAATYVDAISRLQRQPMTSRANLISLNEADDILLGS